jgi:hypothetical protein
MAKPTEAKKLEPEPVDYLVGFRKVGTNAYACVKVRLVGGKVVEHKVDNLGEPMEHTAQTVALLMTKMIQSGEIP